MPRPRRGARRLGARETGASGRVRRFPALPNLRWKVFDHFLTKPFSTRCGLPRTVGCMSKITTPFGPATLVERITLQQKAGEKRFGSVVELLETDRGDRLVRVAYTTGGATRRGPVTLRVRDLERLRDALEKAPALAGVLRGD